MAACALAAPPQYKSPEAMAEALNDFPLETGAFKVLKRQPLHLQISIKDQPVKDASAMYRAFVWGVFRTFLHTGAKSVTVTVVSPMAVEGISRMTETVTREHAEAVVRGQLGIGSLAELVTERMTWTDAAKRCLYSDMGKPGLRGCALKLAGRND